MFRLVENSTRWKTSLSKKNTTAIAICARNFCLLVKPWLFFLTTMMSSIKPIKPKPIVTNNNKMIGFELSTKKIAIIEGNDNTN